MPLLLQLSSREVQGMIEKLVEATSQVRVDDQRPQPSARAFRRQRRLTPAEVQSLIAQYQAGDSINELARVLGVDRSVVSRQLDRAGQTKRRPGLTFEDLERIEALYAAGWSLARLGREFHVHGKTVAAHLRSVGIAVRGRGRPRAS